MFQQGCYITTVFADGWTDHDDTCHDNPEDVTTARRQLRDLYPDAHVHVIRAYSRDELERKREALGICRARVLPP